MPVTPDPRGAPPELMPFLRWVRDNLLAMIAEQARASLAGSNTNSSQNSTMSTLVERLGSVEAIMATLTENLVIDASQVTSGVFPLARIPGMDVAHIPGLDASHIISGTLSRPVSTVGDIHGTGNGIFNAAWNYDVSAITRRAMWMDVNGRLGHTSSSRKGKADIHDWEPHPDAIRAVRVVRFHRRHGIGLLEGKWDHGVIAEELDELGLDWLVSYEDDGITPHGVHYEMFGLALLPLVQKLANEVDELKEERDATNARLEAIEARLASLEGSD